MCKTFILAGNWGGDGGCNRSREGKGRKGLLPAGDGDVGRDRVGGVGFIRDTSNLLTGAGGCIRNRTFMPAGGVGCIRSTRFIGGSVGVGLRSRDVGIPRHGD